MKRILSALLCLSMICSLPATAFAVESLEATKEVTINGYTFEITENTNDDYSVTRTYSRPAAATRSIPSKEETVALLLSLGYSEDEINAMSEKTIAAFATARNIYTTTSYIKHNEETNITVGLPKEDAIQEAQILSEQQMEYYMNMENTPTPLGIIDNESTTPGKFLDTYMEMTHSAVDEGGGDYTYVTDATWLTMPFWRGYDSVGSCAKGGSADPYSGDGYFYYYTTTINGGSIGRPVYSGRQDMVKSEDSINGDWYGYAGVFTLPKNIYNTQMGISIVHEDLHAHFTYTGSVTNPELITNFNTNGSYSHSTIALQFEPSISIDAKGEASASIGISIAGDKDVRIAPLKVTYRP